MNQTGGRGALPLLDVFAAVPETVVVVEVARPVGMGRWLRACCAGTEVAVRLGSVLVIGNPRVVLLELRLLVDAPCA